MSPADPRHVGCMDRSCECVQETVHVLTREVIRYRMALHKIVLTGNRRATEEARDALNSHDSPACGDPGHVICGGCATA